MKDSTLSRRSRRLFAAAIWFAAACLPFAASATSPWDAWRLGYTNFELGQQLRDRGDYTRAREAFVKARDHYDMVRKARPDWNQRVIRERLADCAKSIAELDRLLGNSAPAEKPKRAEVSESEKRQSEIVLLRTRLAEATVEIADLKRAAGRRRDFESEIAHLLRDQRIAAEKYALLEKRFNELQKESDKPDRRAAELQERLVAERMKNELGEQKLRAAEASIRRSEQELLKSRHELRRNGEQLRLLRENAERLGGEAENLRNAFREATSERDSARGRTAELEKQLTELTEARAALEKRLAELAETRAELEKRLAARPAAPKNAATPHPAALSGAEAAELGRLRAELAETRVKLGNQLAELTETRAKLGSAERRERGFQQECTRLRRENDRLMKLAADGDSSRGRIEKDRARLAAELSERSAALELTAGELKSLRALHAKTEAEFKLLSDRKRELETRLSKRESDDFKALTSAKETRKQLNDEIAALRNAKAEERARAEVAEKRVAELSGKLAGAESAARRSDAERITLRQRLAEAEAEAAKYRELAPQYAALRRNFTALQQENRENKLAADAAKPREAELNRIKLRLAELDQLKQSLAKEQRLNEELNNARRRQEKELVSLRRSETELAAAKRRLAGLAALEKEAETLRQLNRQLTREHVETEKIEEVRKKLIEAEAAQLELFDLKKQYTALVKDSEALRARIAELASAAGEAARLRSAADTLRADGEKREKKLRELSSSAAALRSEKRDLEIGNRSLTAEIAALKQENAALRNRPEPKPQVIVKEIRIPVASDTGDREAAKKEAEKIAAELAEVRKESESSRRAEELARDEAKRIAAELAEARREAESGRRAGELARGEAKESAAANAALRADLDRLRADLAQLRGDFGKVRSDLAASRAEGNRLRTELALGKSRIGELESLVPQMEKLRRFNDQLMYARSFEKQLAEAKIQLARLSRVQDELARTAKLNGELIEAKKQLEAELARRPRFGNPDLMPSLSIVSANLREKPADYIAAARLALADDSPELAVWNYRKALELDGTEPEALAELGMLLLRREEYPEAVRLLTAARATRPGDLKLALAAAKANLAVKRAGNARAILEPLLRDHAKLAELQTLLGLALAGSGDGAGAEARLRLAMRCDPKYAAAPLELARLIHHADAARRNEALRFYEEYRLLGGEADLELEPVFGAMLDNRRDVESFLTAAAAEAAAGKDYQATAWYCRRLIELNRDPERFVPLLAFAQLKQGSPSAARETLTFHKSTPLGLLVRALIDHREKDAAAAILSCRQARSMNGGRPVAVPPQWSALLGELASLSGENSDVGREVKVSFAAGR